jgi:hypothetical protein
MAFPVPGWEAALADAMSWVMPSGIGIIVIRVALGLILAGSAPPQPRRTPMTSPPRSARAPRAPCAYCGSNPCGCGANATMKAKP